MHQKLLKWLEFAIAVSIGKIEDSELENLAVWSNKRL